MQACGSASDLVEDAENPDAETSNDPESNRESNKSEADTEGGAAGDGIDSHAPEDFLSPSPPGTKTMHSVAMALDGTRVQCTGCGKKQKVLFFTPKALVWL